MRPALPVPKASGFTIASVVSLCIVRPPICHGLRRGRRFLSPGAPHISIRLPLRALTAISSTKSAGRSATAIPQSRNAFIFSAAVPSEPEIMAPACPIRRPGGAVCPAMKPTTGFVIRSRTILGSHLLIRAADLAEHADGLGLRVRFERFEAIHEIRADQRVPPDADAGGLSDSGPGELEDHLVRKRPGPADDAYGPRHARSGRAGCRPCTLRA